MSLTMRPVVFFRWSLILPALVPLADWLLSKLDGRWHFSLFLLGTVLAGGLPYLMVVTLLMVISRRASYARFMLWWRLSPFLMALAVGLCLAVAWPFSNGQASALGVLGAWLGVSLYCLAVGYAYIALAGLVFALLEKAGGVRRPHWLDANPPGDAL